VGAAMGIGMVLGPGMGGLLAKLSLSFPFFLASALSLAALVLIFIFLPEAPRTLEEQTETKNEPRLQAMLQALKGPLGVLFLMSFLLSFAITNFESIFGLYASDRYSYSPGQVGLILTVVGVLSAFMQGVMTGPATRRFGDAAVVRASLAGTAIGFLLMTQARTFPQVMLTVGIFIVSNALLNPSVASMISKRTDNAQGMTMGLNNSFLSLGRIAGPLWAGFVYDINLNAPYLSGATIMLVGFGVSLLALQAISYRSVPAETNLQDL